MLLAGEEDRDGGLLQFDGEDPDNPLRRRTEAEVAGVAHCAARSGFGPVAVAGDPIDEEVVGDDREHHDGVAEPAVALSWPG